MSITKVQHVILRGLTERQLEVVVLMRAMLTPEQIAQKIGISRGSVEERLVRASVKLLQLDTPTLIAVIEHLDKRAADWRRVSTGTA